ncbi:hypothetical protein [Amycolatopsis sp. cmx-11-12]|uniref:hypothetical protein n=1 Tax=Amycolatopsis sp. cmx-11-12 TaxID=2785795 RepID=UPI003918208B
MHSSLQRRRTILSTRTRLRSLFALVAATLLAVSVSVPANAAVSSAPAGTSGVEGLYLLNSRYNRDIGATRGWQVTWQVPAVTNGNDAQGVVGQWYYNLESGIYYNNDVGWAVYFYGDDNGLENNPDCSQTWSTGSICRGFSHLPVGKQLTFIYEYCYSGSQICLYVDLRDGKGRRYLTSDKRSTVEMYAHDIETFADSNRVEPKIPCDRPTKMVRQSVKFEDGRWYSPVGNWWTFEDESSRYQYRNINTSANPANWESCSE